MTPQIFDKQRIILTGITGFTGHVLAPKLREAGAEVFGLIHEIDKKESPDLIYAPLSDADAIQKAFEEIRPDYVIHLAGISYAAHDNSLPYYDVNVIGTENLLKACVAQKNNIKRVILASSAAIYGDPELDFISEDQPPNPISHYGCSKLTMEYIAALYKDKLPITVTRPFNYTGPGQANIFLIPKIVLHFRELQPTISLGNTAVLREFSDVRDVADQYLSLLLCEQIGTVNLCSGQAHTIDDVINILTELTAHKIEIKTNPEFVRPNDIRRLVGDNSKLKNMSNSAYQITLKSTLKDMLHQQI